MRFGALVQVMLPLVVGWKATLLRMCLSIRLLFFGAMSAMSLWKERSSSLDHCVFSWIYMLMAVAGWLGV